jgi:hypothetical protein
MSTPRVIEVVEDIERSLLEVIRKHRVTHDEYRLATGLLIDSIKEGEESLLFDVFFEAEATEVGNAGRQGSPAAIEGPFHLLGAPELAPPYALPQRPDERASNWCSAAQSAASTERRWRARSWTSGTPTRTACTRTSSPGSRSGTSVDGLVHCGHIHECWGQESRVGDVSVRNLGPDAAMIEVDT